MPKELTVLEEIDLTTEIYYPDQTYSVETQEEMESLARYINSLSNRRILLLADYLFAEPYVLWGLNEGHIETIIKAGKLELKKTLITILLNPIIMEKMLNYFNKLDNREKTTENSTRFKNILQYLRDNRFIV